MAKLTATFLSLFPESIRSIVQSSILGRAVSAGILQIREVQIREYALDKQKKVDDSPCGGGPGQLMKVDVMVGALRAVLEKDQKKTRIILMDPAGKLFTQEDAKRLAHYEQLIFVCGRYEGIDARVYYYVDEILSIGDYVLTGGELPALVMLDAVTRMVPDVLGNALSVISESHQNGMLEASQYTRPIDFEGHFVPQVSLSGNHRHIDQARLGEKLLRTQLIRPDLFSKLCLDAQDIKRLEEAEQRRPFSWEK
jgi:tRNA (guanine37-N1)-methyltransferase